MSEEYSPSPWQAVIQQELWSIVDKNNKKIATLEKSVKSREYARMIAASPYMLEALQNLVELIGDEDLPDNGELSGAAISDMIRSAVDLASN